MRRHTMAAIAAGILAAAAFATIPAVAGETTGEAAARTEATATVRAAANNDPDFVVVYNNNVENLPTVNLTCPGDWQDLVYYLQLAPLKPDIFTIQQISNQAQLNSYTDRLSSALGERYVGVIAQRTPSTILRGKCGEPKYYQTNAVIFRAARFTDQGLGHRTWQAQSDETGDCANNDQARTIAVKVRLHDKIAGRDLTVASVHWPTGRSGGPPCARSNANELAAELTEDGYGGSLLISGGDHNFSDIDWGAQGDPFRAWFRSMSGDLGGRHNFRDAGYDGCSGSKSCLSNNWTINHSRRIDFIFAKRTAGGLPNVTNFHTVTFNEGDAADEEVTGTDRGDRDYSDHRAVRAHIYY